MNELISIFYGVTVGAITLGVELLILAVVRPIIQASREWQVAGAITKFL